MLTLKRKEVKKRASRQGSKEKRNEGKIMV